MTTLQLPTGVHTFREIREDNCYYVDKTAYALQLVQKKKYFFLSRPRRFGKSLFLDTLKELFEGSRDLFQGLHAYDRWDWSLRNPVVRLDFGKGNFKEPGYLQVNVAAQLLALEGTAGIESPHQHPVERFAFLIEQLRRVTGQKVVVLVDEYDKPILDALEEPSRAEANRDFLRGLYSVIKYCDSHIRFGFVTGVSKFSKVSLFSGLNNLRDITLSPKYSAICGYRERDLDEVFAPELPGLDREQIREWYNGYSWGGEEKVYNPFDVLLLFEEREFKAWWFETATPTFLVKTLVKRCIPATSFDGMLASDSLLSSFDVGKIAPAALMFQSGYLTMVGRESRRGRLRYRLGYPNREVRIGLNESLADFLTGDDVLRSLKCDELESLMESADFKGLEELFRSLFASIPYQWHTRNDIASYEGYYATVFITYFEALGVNVTPEASTSSGRADLVVRLGGRIFVFEFKVADRTAPGAALERLKARGYAEKYSHKGKPIYLVGVEFKADTRNVKRFDVELAYEAADAGSMNERSLMSNRHDPSPKIRTQGPTTEVDVSLDVDSQSLFSNSVASSSAEYIR